MAEAAQPTQLPGTGPGHRAPSLEEVTAAFPQFEILELIGVGGMGTVWRARQPKLNRHVALKLLPASLAERDPAFAERFEREGQLLARLHHPNIVTVHDSGRAGDFFYLLMEFVDGVNLRQAMRASRFTPQQALAIVPKICDALQYAHEEGVLHRDIKPENILLDTKGRVKLVDFGIAKLMAQAEAAPAGTAAGNVGAPPAHSLTVSDSTLGTPNYMAPEQVAQPAEVDHRADIYSLGVVFYELLTGELPLGKFAPPSERFATDPRLDGIVRQALEKERAQRQQSAAELRTQVETVASTDAPSPPQSKPEERRLPWLLPQVICRDGKPIVCWPVVMNMLALQFGVQAAAVLLIWLVVGRIFPLHHALALTAINALAITAVCLGQARKNPGEGVRPARVSPRTILVIAILIAIGTGATFYLVSLRARAAEKRAPGPATIAGPMVFGAVVERVLPFDGSFVDFQSGSVMRPDWNNFAVVHDLDPWLEKTGADAVVEESPSDGRFGDKGFPRLVSHPSNHPERHAQRESCVFVSEGKDDFDTVQPGNADARLKVVTERNLWWGLAEGAGPWWFQSRDGAKGVLQILGKTDTPRGLKIRYKLLVPEGKLVAPTAAR
jgi:tRNA A-37 threonylcarbamoyl transferase component Bud32